MEGNWSNQPLPTPFRCGQASLPLKARTEATSFPHVVPRHSNSSMAKRSACSWASTQPPEEKGDRSSSFGRCHDATTQPELVRCHLAGNIETFAPTGVAVRAEREYPRLSGVARGGGS